MTSTSCVLNKSNTCRRTLENQWSIVQVAHRTQGAMAEGRRPSEN